jgi:hypothetical protein
MVGALQAAVRRTAMARAVGIGRDPLLQGSTAFTVAATQEPVMSKRQRSTLAKRSAELAFAVPPVMAHRIARMALAGASPSERDRREFTRMSAEKTAAFQQSWMAMAMQAWRAQQAFAVFWWRASLSPWGPPSAQAIGTQLHSAALGVLGQGLAPVHRTAVANAKRLSRTRLR